MRLLRVTLATLVLVLPALLSAAAARATIGDAPGLGREECLLPPAVLAAVAAGEQVRVGTDAGFALFTVRRADAGDRPALALSADGRARLAVAIGDTVGIAWPPLIPGLTDREARDRGEAWEQVVCHADDPDAVRHLLLLVPHGGFIESGTDAIGKRVLEHPGLRDRAIGWIFRGYRPGGGAYDRWHITSTAIAEDSFPTLGDLVAGERRFAHAIALHGHRGDAILVGGGAPADDRQRLARLLRAQGLPTTVRVLRPGDRLAGSAADNIVNRYSARGLQLELPRRIRRAHGAAVAAAILAYHRGD